MSAVFAGGNSSGALSSTGTVYVWGDNASSQLHNGKSVNLSDPTSLTSGAASIAFGEHHSLMLKTSGSVSSAGSGAFGELFSKAADSTASPELIMKDVSSYSAGYDHAAAVDANGRLYTWGNNDCGQLGLGDTVMRTEPTRVTSVKADFAKVWCGNKVTFALTTDGDVYVFGENSNNLLGTKTKTKTVSTPTINSYLYDKSRNIEIYPSDGFCLALIDGAVYGWGSNSAGRLLDLNKTVSEPTELTSGLGSITKLAVGSSHVLALDSRGTVWVWGSNSLRQLGFESDSYIVDEPTALEITNSKGETVETSFNDIAAAESHSLVVGSDGKLWAFGTNSSGQLGTSDYRLKTPTSITTGISSVYAGASVCAVIDTNGKLYLSGSNTNGALGDGTVTDRSNFYNITLTKAKSASIGNGFAGAIDTDNSLYCWGDNSFGAVGNGSGGAKSEPETVIKDALCLSIKQAEGISLSKTELTVKPNGTASLKATITPSDASANVTWTSSDSRIATVTDGGIVKGVALGTATITASTSNGLTASCLVTVTVPVTSFSVTPSKSKTLDIGKSFTITSKIYPTNATDKTLLYSSSDEDVAEVSASGKVTALSSGRTVITVTAKSNPAKTRKITVTVRPAKVVITSRKSTTNGVKLKWNDAEGADGYEVFRKLSGSSSSAKSVGDAGDSNSFTDDTAKKGKTYVYSVKSYVVIDGKKVYSANSKQYKITGK
jgi:alpha-tubulin suppressor-like RCC1 family protein